MGKCQKYEYTSFLPFSRFCFYLFYANYEFLNIQVEKLFKIGKLHL